MEEEPTNGRRKPADSSSQSGEDDQLLLAACLVGDARDGLHSDYKTDSKSLRLYLMYRHWSLNYALYVLILVQHALAFFETAGKRRSETESHIDAMATTIEVLCLLYYISRIVLYASLIPAFRFWHDAKNIIVMTVIALTFLDILLYFTLPPASAIRWSPVLRPLFIVNFGENRQIRRAIRNIRHTLPDIINVLILFGLSVATFSIIGLKLFETRGIVVTDGPTSLNTTYFSNFPDIFFNLYVLVTTSNNPDIMMPAYNSNRWYAIYFILFLIVNLYLFMNIILAVVYNNYRKHLKNEVKNLLTMKRGSLARAFDLLTIERASSASEPSKLTADDFRTLMAIVFAAPSTLKSSPHMNVPVSKVLWSLLEQNGSVDKGSFLKLAELLNMNVKLIPLDKRSSCILEHCVPSIYNSRASRSFRSAVKSKYFRYAFDLLILINAILIATEADRRVNKMEWVLLLAFMLEILAKIYAFGFALFIKKLWNIFDTIVIGAAVVLWLVIGLKFSPEKNLEQYLDLFLILRVLRLWKVIADIERFSVVVKTVQALLPSILTYGGLLFVVFYVYAIVGMQVFREKIPMAFECSNSTVHCCPKGASGLQYCTINFNTMETSLLYLFDLMVVNQWHVMAKNIEIVMDSKWTRLYFVSFHLICVIAVLNIFTAFVLEAFILEYTNVTEGNATSSELQEKIHQLGISSFARIRESNQFDDDHLDLVDADHDDVMSTNGTEQSDDPRSRKTRSTSIISFSNALTYRVVLSEKKSVEALLLRMFESELKSEQI